MLDFVIRQCTATDEGFVAKSFVDTARGGTRQTRLVESGFFNRWAYAIAGELLERCEVRIAAPPDDDSTIYGFCVLEPGLVHMVYVKKPLRRLGIARALLAGVPLEESQFSVWSQDCTNWILEKHPGLRYRPFYIMESAHGGASEAAAAK